MGRKKAQRYWYDPADMAAHTSHLSLEEFGAFQRILNWMWCHGPQQHRMIANPKAVALAALSNEEKAISLIAAIQNPLQPLFKVRRGQYASPRLKEEWEKWMHRSDQATQAITGRWQRYGRNTNVLREAYHQEKEKEKEKESTPLVPYANISDYWACHKRGMPECRPLSPARKAKLAIRWKTREYRDNWETIIDRASASDFLNGTNDRGWKATFEWVMLHPTHWESILDGKYDRGAAKNPNKPKSLEVEEGKYADFER